MVSALLSREGLGLEISVVGRLIDWYMDWRSGILQLCHFISGLVLTLDQRRSGNI